MKQLLLKYAPLFIALTALADTQFDLLIQIGLTETAIGWIKLLGLLTALFLPSVSKTFMREVTSKDLKEFDGFDDLKIQLKGTNTTQSQRNTVSQTFDNSDPQNPVKPSKPR